MKIEQKSALAAKLEQTAARQLSDRSFSSANLVAISQEEMPTTAEPNTASAQSVEFNIDLRQYSQEALNAVLYTYSGQFFVEQKLDAAGCLVQVKLLLKDLASTLSTQEQHQLRGEFYQNLIDQQVRLDLEQRFGHIRDLLVAEAFKPVN